MFQPGDLAQVVEADVSEHEIHIGRIYEVESIMFETFVFFKGIRARDGKPFGLCAFRLRKVDSWFQNHIKKSPAIYAKGFDRFGWIFAIVCIALVLAFVLVIVPVEMYNENVEYEYEKAVNTKVPCGPRRWM